MFTDDSKKYATAIVSKRKGNGARSMAPTPMKPEIVKKENGEMDGRHLAAQDIIAAHHEGSAQRLSEALGHFLDMHKMADSPEPPKE